MEELQSLLISTRAQAESSSLQLSKAKLRLDKQRAAHRKRNGQSREQKLQLSEQQARLTEQDLKVLHFQEVHAEQASRTSNLQYLLAEQHSKVLEVQEHLEECQTRLTAMNERVVEEIKLKDYYMQKLEGAPKAPWAKRLRTKLRAAEGDAAAARKTAQEAQSTLIQVNDQLQALAQCALDMSAAEQDALAGLQDDVGPDNYKVLEEMWQAVCMRSDSIFDNMEAAFSYYSPEITKLGARAQVAWISYNREVAGWKLPRQDPVLEKFLMLVRTCSQHTC